MTQETRSSRHLSAVMAAALALVLAAAVILLPVSAAAKNRKDPEKLRVFAISDTHVLAPELVKDTEDYRADNAVGKAFREGLGNVDAHLKEAEKNKADIVIISGDLTKDGELESHRALAKRLRAFKKSNPKSHVYVINGNHDINNKNGKNYNTEDGKAVKATRTTPADFYNTYKDITYDDPTVVEKFQPADGKQAGQESYVARPKKGYTLIAIDTCRYSSDNSGSGKDEHNTSGQISADLEAWVLKQIKAAKERGDTIIGLEHHNLLPHFQLESVVMVDYVIHDWKRLSTEFANAGMHYVFTGHEHAMDVAKATTQEGNDLYDFQTGAVCAYPSASRLVDFTRSWDKKTGRRTETVDGKIINHLKVTYYDAIVGKDVTIPDMTEYTKANYGIDFNMINRNVYGYALRSFNDLAENVGMELTQEDMDAIYNFVDDVLGVKVSKDGHNVLQLVAYANERFSGGEDNGPVPAWVDEGCQNVASGQTVKEVVNCLVKEAPEMGYQVLSSLFGQMLFPANVMASLHLSIQHDIIDPIWNAATGAVLPQDGNVLSDSVLKTVSAFAADYLNTTIHDTNYPDDCTFHIVEKEDAHGNFRDGVLVPPAESTNDSELYNTIRKVMTKVGDYV